MYSSRNPFVIKKKKKRNVLVWLHFVVYLLVAILDRKMMQGPDDLLSSFWTYDSYHLASGRRVQHFKQEITNDFQEDPNWIMHHLSEAAPTDLITSLQPLAQHPDSHFYFSNADATTCMGQTSMPVFDTEPLLCSHPPSFYLITSGEHRQVQLCQVQLGGWGLAHV